MSKAKLRRSFFTSYRNTVELKLRWQCFQGLVAKEMYLFLKNCHNTFLDVAFMLATNAVVFGYFMSSKGLGAGYGPFILVGAIATFGLFDITWKATLLAHDMHQKKINNYLTLPVSTGQVFFSFAVSWGMQTGLISLVMIPIGKIILWNQWDLAYFNIWKYLLIFIPANLFYGVFALWVSSLVTNLRNTSWMWYRLINPLFMFCGFYYSWKSVYQLSHEIGYLHLINPLLYILEGTKGAVLPPEGFLPFGYCVLAVWFFIFVMGYDAIKRLKKRVDSV